MKRARLTVAPQTKKTEAPDLTDRLLEKDAAVSGEPTPRPARSPVKRAAARPKVKTVETPPPASAAFPTGSPVQQKPDALAEALAQSNVALTALRAAALAEPGRYDLALRYRLDALAHHLRQVSEFVQASKQRGG
jgi:hypothetical protein